MEVGPGHPQPTVDLGILSGAEKTPGFRVWGFRVFSAFRVFRGFRAFRVFRVLGFLGFLGFRALGNL